MKANKGSVMKSIIKNALWGGVFLAGAAVSSVAYGMENRDAWELRYFDYYWVWEKGEESFNKALLMQNNGLYGVHFVGPDEPCDQIAKKGLHNNSIVPSFINGKSVMLRFLCVENKEGLDFDAVSLSADSLEGNRYIVDQFKNSQEVVYKIGDNEFVFSAMGFTRALRDFQRTNR
ncbi:hypothetical protein ACU6TU_09775 [Halomonas sp. LS-001]